MEEGRQFQIVDAAIWSEQETPDRSVQGTYTLAEEDDRSVWNVMTEKFCKR